MYTINSRHFLYPVLGIGCIYKCLTHRNMRIYIITDDDIKENMATFVWDFL